MSNSVEYLIKRTIRSARDSAESGSMILSREKDDTKLDSHSLRSAANQFRQAAAELDRLDGIIQAQQYQKEK